jgi:hypothetical protein
VAAFSILISDDRKRLLLLLHAACFQMQSGSFIKKN